ncbi:unnamed protein product [Closterium sp. NIES-54]
MICPNCSYYPALLALPCTLCPARRAARLLPSTRPARCPIRALPAHRLRCQRTAFAARALHLLHACCSPRPRSACARSVPLAPCPCIVRPACALPAHCWRCPHAAHMARAARALPAQPTCCPAPPARALHTLLLLLSCCCCPHCAALPCRAAPPCRVRILHTCLRIPHTCRRIPHIRLRLPHMCRRIPHTCPRTLPVMAMPPVLEFAADGLLYRFNFRLYCLHLHLQCYIRDGISLLEHTSGSLPTPTTPTKPAGDADEDVQRWYRADSLAYWQWTERDAVAQRAVRSLLPIYQRDHF